MSNVVVTIPLHHTDAADVEAGLRRAAACCSDQASRAPDEKTESYHRRLAARYSELAELVKKRAAPDREKVNLMALENGETPDEKPEEPAP